jgi:hypothetical protein
VLGASTGDGANIFLCGVITVVVIKPQIINIFQIRDSEPAICGIIAVRFRKRRVSKPPIASVNRTIAKWSHFLSVHGHASEISTIRSFEDSRDRCKIALVEFREEMNPVLPRSWHNNVMAIFLACIVVCPFGGRNAHTITIDVPAAVVTQ